MKSLGLFLLASFLLVAGAIPQDFSDLVTVYPVNSNSSGEQYYSVQYLGDSPESAASHYNLAQTPLDTGHDDDTSEIDEYDIDKDDGLEDFFYENGFVVVNNDDVYDYSYLPRWPGDAQFAAYESTEDSANVDQNSDGKISKEIRHNDEDNVDTKLLASTANQNETTSITPNTLNISTTEAVPNESSTSSLGSSSTNATTNETTSVTAPASGIEDYSDLDHETNYESTELQSDFGDHVIPVFVHPIHRPSSQWPLNVTQIGNINSLLNQRRPLRRRRPQINRRPQKNKRRRRRKPQKGNRKPANGLKNRNRRKRPYRRKRPVRIPLRPTNLNSIHKFFTPKSCATCQCGVTTTRRIVGGTVATVNEFPWLALIAYNGSIQCGGTLITDRHVLTAAHCVRGFAIKQFQIRFLEYNRLESSETTLVVRRAAKIYTLASYKANTADNDVGIILLSAKIDFANTTVRPICLPPGRMSFTGKTGTIAGWGTTSENGQLSKILRKASVPILSNQQCQFVGMKITKNMLCAGRLLTGGIDACQGDSGGPLMVVLNKRYYLAGVVSWGDGCARPKKPGVYARVTRYLDWIKRLSLGSCPCT